LKSVPVTQITIEKGIPIATKFVITHRTGWNIFFGLVMAPRWSRGKSAERKPFARRHRVDCALQSGAARLCRAQASSVDLLRQLRGPAGAADALEPEKQTRPVGGWSDATRRGERQMRARATLVGCDVPGKA
jgi:hypothetical protein